MAEARKSPTKPGMFDVNSSDPAHQKCKGVEVYKLVTDLGNKHRKTLHTLISKQMQVMQSIECNTADVRRKLLQHAKVLQEGLHCRVQELLMSLDELHERRMQKVCKSIEQLKECQEDIDQLESTLVETCKCILERTNLAPEFSDILARGITDDLEKAPTLTFTPFYSLDVGMIGPQSEGLTYNMADFRTPNSWPNLSNIDTDSSDTEDSDPPKRESSGLELPIRMKGKSSPKDGKMEPKKYPTPARRNINKQKAEKAKLPSNINCTEPEQGKSSEAIAATSAMASKKAVSKDTKKDVNVMEYVPNDILYENTAFRPAVNTARSNVAVANSSPTASRSFKTEYPTVTTAGVTAMISTAAEYTSSKTTITPSNMSGQNSPTKIPTARGPLVPPPNHVKSTAGQEILSEPEPTAAPMKTYAVPDKSVSKPIPNAPGDQGATGGPKSPKIAVPLLPEKPKVLLKRQMGVPSEMQDNEKNARKEAEIWFITSSEANCYSKAKGLTGFPASNKNSKPVETVLYNEVVFAQNTKKRASTAESENMDEEPKSPPLPPRLYKLGPELSLEMPVCTSPTSVKEESPKPVPPSRPPPLLIPREVNAKMQGEVMPALPPKQTSPDGSKSVFQAAGAGFDNGSPKTKGAVLEKVVRDDKPDAKKQDPEVPKKELPTACKKELLPQKAHTPAFKPRMPFMRKKTQLTDRPRPFSDWGAPSCEVLTPEILVRIRQNGNRASSSMGETFVPSTIYDNVMMWHSVHLKWQSNDVINAGGAIFLKGGKVVVIDGNCVKVLGEEGQLLSKCELKQLDKHYRRKLSCSAEDSLIITDALSRRILAIPSDGYKVKGTQHIIKDFTPEHVARIQDGTGYAIGGKIIAKDYEQAGVVIVNEKMAETCRWQCKANIGDICVDPEKHVYVALVSKSHVDVYNTTGVKLRSFGDKQTMYHPSALCVDTIGDILVVHQVSSENLSFKVSMWSAGGSKKADVLMWNKSKMAPNVCSSGQKIVLSAENIVACYNISF